MWLFCIWFIQKQNFSTAERDFEKDEIISFLTEQLSVKNAFTIPLQNQSQERRSANNNPLNDSIESKVPRGEAHTIKLNKKRKVVVTGDSLLNGIRESIRRNRKLKPDCR